jgi:Uma2 family endonuclease
MNIALKPMTVESYLAWLAEQPGGRYELVNGQVVPMNAQRVGHIETKVAVARALQDALRGGSCHALGDGMAVKIDDTTVFEPDALVYCGERLARGTVIFSTPVVVVEILSPGTKTVDTTKKLEGYFKLPAVRHYLIVDPEARAIVHHARSATGDISTAVVTDGEIVLDALSARLPVAGCFAE